jgi:hypothetical protein
VAWLALKPVSPIVSIVQSRPVSPRFEALAYGPLSFDDPPVLRTPAILSYSTIAISLSWLRVPFAKTAIVTQLLRFGHIA